MTTSHVEPTYEMEQKSQPPAFQGCFRAIALPSRPQLSAQRPDYALQLWLLANHELRQPIGSLALLAEVLKSDCTPSQRRAIAVRIELVARSLEQMLDQLYRLSLHTGERGEAGSTCLSSILRAVVDELSPTAAEAGIHIQPPGLRQPDMAIQLHAPSSILADLLKAMLLYPIKLGTGHTIDIAVRRRGRYLYVDVGFDGPDPTGALQRQAFVELAPHDGKSNQLVQGLGLAMASMVAQHLDLVLSSGSSRGGKQRLTLRIARSPTRTAH